MESVAPSDPGPDRAPEQTARSDPSTSSRDPDLVALEWLESEFAALETELERGDRPNADGGAAEPTP